MWGVRQNTHAFSQHACQPFPCGGVCYVPLLDILDDEGAVVRQDGSLMRCLGSRMTTRFAAAAHRPLVQHPSRYSLWACDAVTCRREGS
jgi:hypothetical protein